MRVQIMIMKEVIQETIIREITQEISIKEVTQGILIKEVLIKVLTYQVPNQVNQILELCQSHQLIYLQMCKEKI